MNIYCYKYTTTLDLLGVVDDFVSFSFQRSFSGVGEFQLVINGNSLNAARVKEANVISVRNGVAGFISKVEEIHSEDSYQITFTGVELKGIVSKRIVYPPIDEAYLKIAAAPETIIATLIQTQLIAPEDSRRTLPLMSIAAYAESSSKINKEYRFSDIQEEIVTLAETYAIGWYADIQDNMIVWHIVSGINRTESQDENSRLVLSYANNLLLESSIEISNGVPTSALVAGQGEGTEREIAYVGNAHSGIFRTEVYIDARDIEVGGDLEQRGYEKLAEYGSDNVFSASFSQALLKRYQVDFDLGDTATIIDSRLPDGKIDIVLTEVEEVYEDYFYINATFGYNKETLANAITRKTSNAEALVYTEPSATTDVESIVKKLLLAAHPIGSIIYTQNAANPSTYIGGTWQRINDRFLYATSVDEEIGVEGGASSHSHTIAEHTHTTQEHTLTVDEMPAHSHGIYAAGTVEAWSPATQENYYPVTVSAHKASNISASSTTEIYNTGGGNAHNHGDTGATALTTEEANNMPPYLKCYGWLRTA